MEGQLRTRSWQDEGGMTHQRTEVQVEQVIFLDARQAPSAGIVEELPEDLGQAEAAPEAEVVTERPRRRRRA